MNNPVSGKTQSQTGPTSDTGDTAVIVAAKDEADRITATVTAASHVTGVDVVVVVDDGSRDDTSHRARRAGARVVRHGSNQGKAAAMESGAEAVRLLDDEEGRHTHRHLLFLDADLQESASEAASIVQPVRAGRADMTVGLLPSSRPGGGGHGFVVRLSRAGIRRATGWAPTQPLNGQRCLTREALEVGLPLARGFGVETALTIDLQQRGLRVQEIGTAFEHRVTGSDWRARWHRGVQFLDVARALAVRELAALRRRRP